MDKDNFEIFLEKEIALWTRLRHEQGKDPISLSYLMAYDLALTQYRQFKQAESCKP